jgi:hypothetical protein
MRTRESRYNLHPQLLIDDKWRGTQEQCPSRAQLFCQVINQPVWILDVTPRKLRLILYYFAALFLQVLFRFLHTLDGNFQARSKGRTSFDKQIEVCSVEADHIQCLARDFKAEFLDVEAGGLHWIFGLNQNISTKCIRHYPREFGGDSSTAC